MREYISSFHVSMPPQSMTTGGRSTPERPQEVERNLAPLAVPAVERHRDALDGWVVEARRGEEEVRGRGRTAAPLRGDSGPGSGR